MVRASSLNGSRFRGLFGKIVAAVLAVVLIFGVVMGIMGTLRDTGESIEPAQSTSAPEEIFTLIQSRQYSISQPAQIPRQYRRTKIQILSASETDSGCEEVLQRYQGTKDPDVAYIDVYSSAQTCSYPRPDNAELYTVGDYSGWISESPTLSTLIEIVVNQGIIRVETDFTRSEIENVIQKFEPISRTAPPDTATVVVSE